MHHNQQDPDHRQIILLCQEIAGRAARLRQEEAKLQDLVAGTAFVQPALAAQYRRLLSVVRERIRRLERLLTRYCT